MYALIVSLKVKPERREEFLSAAAEDGRGSREDEPGCLRFDVLQDAADPDHFFYYEVYRDEAAYKAHTEAPHYQVWRAAVEAGVLDGPAQVARCRTCFPTDATWR